MGIIALGRHVELDEPVAIKFLKPDVVAADASGTLASRFVREARATIKIRSEHVPRIFDVTTLDAGVPYIVMELLVGEDLDKRLERDGPLPITFVVDLLLQSLEALAAAHALGMVHRDLKPANLFVATRLDGTTCVKVLDFGIAKLVDRTGAGIDTGLTDSHAAMGSPRYMSPEQMRSARDVDGARRHLGGRHHALRAAGRRSAVRRRDAHAGLCGDLAGRAGIDPPAPARGAGGARSGHPPLPREEARRSPGATSPSWRRRWRRSVPRPLADELALRAARVLGVAASPSPSSPSLTAARVIPASSGTPVARELANIGSTSTSWDAARVAVPSGRRRTRTLATVSRHRVRARHRDGRRRGLPCAHRREGRGFGEHLLRRRRACERRAARHGPRTRAGAERHARGRTAGIGWSRRDRGRVGHEAAVECECEHGSEAGQQARLAADQPEQTDRVATRWGSLG